MEVSCWRRLYHEEAHSEVSIAVPRRAAALAPRMAAFGREMSEGEESSEVGSWGLDDGRSAGGGGD